MGNCSVAIATYNGEQYLGEELDSILPQLAKDDEIVISDDGSTDQTIQVVKRYQEKDSRIILLQGPGKGIKQNIANAIAACKGNYIFLADQDDIWMPGKVRRILELFTQNDTHLIVHDNIVTGADLSTVIYPSFFQYRGSGAGVCRNLWKNKYIGCCMTFSAELKPIILPVPDDIQMHDQWIGVLNDFYYKDTVFLEEPLIYYRRHETNVSDFGHNSIPVMLINRCIFFKRLVRRIVTE